ncbi:hypothetical protein [Lentzea sp. NEAU-D7]|uniref:hypothetical protein n=1 Tax=Lentzea sp. NEAU-D7 TaxID=2994667 RepID=UPI00224B1556|nr:hypothetical protein [Lentzea sp. NEAU-D7]MCX2952144.1 hypothetical protein [Lentzea sp. NEAU-D7]
MIDILPAAAVALSGLVFKYLTVREFTRRAEPRDLPAIAARVCRPLFPRPREMRSHGRTRRG